MDVLIIGSKGMAGHMIAHYMKENSDMNIFSWSREEFDVKNDGEWKWKIVSFLERNNIKFLINCIGVLKPVANKNNILGIMINSLFPHELREICSKTKTKLIHLSTDCYNDLDVYGRSKRTGEIDSPEHLTIRTSIIGPELKDNGCGLFDWFMSEKEETSGFLNHYWDGITTLHLAKSIKNIIEEDKYAGIKELRTKEKISKYDLLNNIKEIFNKNILLNKKETEIVDKTNPNPDISYELDLKQQIIEMKDWMDNHRELYKRYEF